MHQVVQSFSEALQLLICARKEGLREVREASEESGSGVAQPTEEPDEDKGTLSEREFEAALNCCKQQFHEHFMETKN